MVLQLILASKLSELEHFEIRAQNCQKCIGLKFNLVLFYGPQTKFIFDSLYEHPVYIYWIFYKHVDTLVESCVDRVLTCWQAAVCAGDGVWRGVAALAGLRPSARADRQRAAARPSCAQPRRAGQSGVMSRHRQCHHLVLCCVGWLNVVQLR